MLFNRTTLPEQNYDAETLATALQNAMNNVTWFGSSLYTVTYNETKNTFTISIPNDNARSFFVPDDSLMELPQFQAQTNPRTAGYTPWYPDWSQLQSCLGLIGLGKRSSAGKSYAEFEAILAGAHLFTTQQTGSIDIRRLHNVYLRSNALRNNSIVGPPQSQTLLCKIPVTTQPGDVLSRYHNGAVHDYIACSNRALSTLDFYVTDYDNNPVDLRGGTLSVEILICPAPL